MPPGQTFRNPTLSKHYPDRFAIAMSDEDGCMLVVKNGDTVVGSVTREDTIKFAQDVLAWAEKLPAIIEVMNGHSV